ncbi:MAG TPA: DUF2851 family protein [Candidatus Tripitaka californicus]|uniref:DUF2851 family protein n=1 Tax=Candidatus Tripitaka californicus TaxID=3367616 RepID=UPI00402773FC|nr:DUF2851 family protein [Planctomycetota bacterium]
MGLFSSEYERLVRLVLTPAVFEQEGVSRQITEEVVRCLWYGRHFLQGRLHTEDGSRLEVLSPGRWNKGGGPDHANAEILLEGRGHLKGDVEVHLLSSDWRRHGHDKQEGYTRVCLHVVFWNDEGGGFVKDLHGRDIPQLALSRHINLPVEELPGPCQELLQQRARYEHWLGHLLEQAGDQRIIARAQRMEGRLEGQSFEEILYRSLMEAMGYKSNVVGFSLLASRVSLGDLRRLVPVDANERETASWIQALLLGASGILQKWSNKDFQDKESKRYFASVCGLWKGLQGKWSGEMLSPEVWRWEGTRPFNSPPRRLAAMSALLARGLEKGLFREFLSPLEEAKGGDKGDVRGVIKKLETIFLSLEDPFWSYHLVLGGNRRKTPARLVGRERMAILLINVIIPLLLLYARRHEDKETEGVLHEIYSQYPRLQPDSIVRFMTERIVPEKSAKIVNSARRQQGLHQLYRDFCQRGDVRCDRCGFYLALGDRGRRPFSL